MDTITENPQPIFSEVRTEQGFDIPVPSKTHAEFMEEHGEAAFRQRIQEILETAVDDQADRKRFGQQARPKQARSKKAR